MRFDNRIANLIETLCFEIFLNEFINSTQYKFFLIFSNLYFRIY